MEFGLSDAQRLMLDSVDRFMARHMPPEEARRRDRDHVPPYDLMPALGQAGFVGLALPREIGGLGQDWRDLCLVQERFAYHAYPVGSILNRLVAFGAMSLIGYGGPRHRTLLPRLIAGEILIALALSEPGAGSDAAAVTTRARRDGDGWRLIGRKTWISDAARADYLLIVARDGEAHSLFLLPRATPGIAMTELPKVGNHCMPSFDIGIDCVVGAETLIGEPGQGMKHLRSTLHYARASMAATVTGCAQAALDHIVAHAKTREQFGRSIGANQAIRHRLADLATRVHQSRLTVRELAWRIATGVSCRREASMAKVAATETLQAVTEAGMQILASAAYSADSDMQRYWRDARLFSFGEGPNEIHRDIIARDMGLT